MDSSSRRRVRVTGIPLDVQKILSRAKSTSSINDYVVGVLAERYGYSWEPSGLPSRRPKVGSSIQLKLPEAIWVEAKEEAVPYSTLSAVIIEALREAA